MALNPDWSPVTFVESSGSLTASAVTVAANDKRRGLVIGNTSDTVMTVRVGGTATAAIGLPVQGGYNLAFWGGDVPSALVTVFCAGTAKTYTIYEWSAA